MIITCNECDSSFNVDDSLIKPSGSKVRCSNCTSVFVAYPQTTDTDDGSEFELEDLDSSLEASPEDGESMQSTGMLNELELDLDDFDGIPDSDIGQEPGNLADDSSGELELGLDLDDDDGLGLDMLDEADEGDELPDLSEFEDLAELDDESFALDDLDEELGDIGLELEGEADTAADSDEADPALEGTTEINLDDLDIGAFEEAEASADADELELGLDPGQDGDLDLSEEKADNELAVEDGDQLDLSDLELALDDIPETDEAALVDADELDFGLEEPAPEKAGAADAAAQVEDADQLDLSDLELALDDIPETGDAEAAAADELDLGLEEPASEQVGAADAAAQVDDADQLNLSDLELELDDTPEAGDAPNIAADELDLGLEEPASDQVGAADAAAQDDDADQLDLSDLELELEDTPEAGGAADLIADELDFGLEESAPDKAGAAEAAAQDDDADQLDLSGLELELDDMPEAGDAAGADADGLDLVLEEPAPGEAETAADESAGDDGELLELDADLEGLDDAVAVGEDNRSDELDLSDLEDILAADTPPESQPGGQETAGDEDLELDLDLELGTAELDAPEQPEDIAADDLELDLADLEEIQAPGDAPVAEGAADSDADELDLEFDIEEPSAQDAGAPAAAGADESAPDDDMLDIEKMLEQGEDAGPGIDSGDEQDLSLELEGALDDAPTESEPDFDLDFDIESELLDSEQSSGGGAAADDSLGSDLLVTDDVDFLGDGGFDEDRSQMTDVVDTDEFDTDEFSDTNDGYGPTDVMPDIDEDQEDQPASKARPVAARKRSKKPVFAVLMLLLLAAGALILPKSLGIHIPYLSDIKVPYISDIDIRIPYLSDWLNPQPQDIAGNLKFTPISRSISGKFVDHSNAGRLFVIRGKLRNEYDHPRSFVKVTGKLYRKGQKLAKSATVYCGNVIPESDLARMDMAAIQKRMKNKSGNKKSNQNIKTGKAVPFMIVFDKLPNNLDEYTVEVASSSI